MVKRKTWDTLSMQKIGELLVQMGINTGILRTTKNLNGRQIILSLKKKKQTTELKSRLLCGLNYLFPVTSIQCQFMQCSGRADHYNSHSNTKAAIKLNYNSKVKKKNRCKPNQIHIVVM